MTARGVGVCRGLAGGAQVVYPVDQVQHVVDGGHFRFSQPIYHHLEQRKNKLNLCKVDFAAWADESKIVTISTAPAVCHPPGPSTLICPTTGQRLCRRRSLNSCRILPGSCLNAWTSRVAGKHLAWQTHRCHYCSPGSF